LGLHKRGIAVGIEAAIEGGSLALFCDGTEIDGMVGSKGISRAEDILPNLDRLLHRNGFNREEIEKVAVSTGPGSFTGIKIGIATAIGLADGLRCPVVGTSALEAMTHDIETDGRILTAVPVGRDFVAAQCFLKTGEKTHPVSNPELLTAIQFIHTFTGMRGHSVLHSGLIERVGSAKSSNIIYAVSNIASLLIKVDLSGLTRKDIIPLFIDRKPFAVVG
jgi:tRNA threonylcarbamoyl adenosine modification protein YeaZ